MKSLSQKHIIFTGGGSSGHVVPNLALIKKFKSVGWEITYVGSKNGLEKELIIKETGVKYLTIATGKLRRYFSWQNFIDPFKIIAGITQSFFLCRKIRPQVVFSKGGFVALPLVMGAWLNRIPIVMHESDLTPGLANKLSFPLVKKFCVTFSETAINLKNNAKVVVTGTPIRQELFTGNAANGLSFCQFSADKKVILIMGGGLGSVKINATVRSILPKLLVNFQVIHICGKDKVDPCLTLPGYKQFEYLYTELADVIACANLIISRAGANSISEFLALNKPHILIPLPLNVSRGDQISNAKYFSAQGLSEVIFEDALSPDILYDKAIWMSEHESAIRQRLASVKNKDSVQLIYDIIILLVQIGERI
jgi:UDP-N-acetylglucosamine--N-acetylmuramyl-(pentapeptide) pyrophosphoryl-undecaprenol N-acetylglucosamine transferase